MIERIYYRVKLNTDQIIYSQHIDVGALEAKLNENIIKDPSKTYLVWKGDKFPNNNVATFKAPAGCTIDWGDGNVETFEVVDSELTTHTYTDGIEYHLISLSNYTLVGDGAFLSCSGLTSITIGNSVTSIGEAAFHDCIGLTSVIWNAKNCTSAGSSSYPIFSGCSELTNVTIGENVKTIPSYAFGFCTGLTNVTIGDGVTSIENNAFYYCRSLKSITIPDSVTSIGSYAFDGCAGLRTIRISTINPPTLHSDAFSETDLEKIVVPKSSIDAYKSAAGWSTYADKIVYEVDSSDLNDVLTQFGALNIQNGTGTGSLVQKRLKSDGVTWTTAKAYQGASTAFGGGTQAGRTEDEFNAYFWDSVNNMPINGGKGKNSDGKILDNNGLTYEKSYSYGVAEGELTKALGRSSHAEGQQTQAIGASSHSEGLLTKSLGTTSHAEGSNSETVGNNSHAEGTQTIAQGYSSHSEGNISKSIGDNSHSEGYNNQSVGANSHAEGSDTIANGLNAHTEGWLSKADGDFSHVEGYKSSVKKTQYVVPEGTGGGSGVTGDAGDSGSDWVMDDHRGEGSHAEGILTQSSGYVSHSEGLRTVADGHYSHAEGQSTYTKGLASHAEGNKSTALGYAAHAEGNTTKASGNSSHSEGYETTSSGAYSHAESVSTIASGDGSHAEGNLSNASGIFSHAEGKETVASNDFSHAEGFGSTASGNTSHAEGSRSVASGQSSHSEGIQTTASHDGSHSEGYQTRTSAINQHVEGVYNSDNPNALHIVGNGTSENARKNAFEVLKDGRAKVQTAPKDNDDVVRKLELDRKFDKAGGTVTGDMVVGGNFTVQGKTTTVDNEHLRVTDKLIEVGKGNTAPLTSPAGLITPKYDGTNNGGIVYDHTGTAYVGDITLDSNGNVNVNNSDLQPIATRDTTITNGNLVKWDSGNHKLVDAGQSVDNLINLNARYVSTSILGG